MFRKSKDMALMLLLCLLWVVWPQVARAQTYYSTTTATLGDKNSSGEYRMTLTNDGVLHYASDTGVLLPYATASTNTTLTAAQTGTTVIFNTGNGVAQDNTKFTLPTAAVGMQYTIVADIAKYFAIKPQSTDTINFNSAAAGEKISNSSTAAAGDSITVFCATANKWSVKDKVGTWAKAGQ